jgi:hypothetical protein
MSKTSKIVTLSDLPESFRAAIAKEQCEARQAAEYFFHVVETGRDDLLVGAAAGVSETSSWREAAKLVTRLPAPSDEIKGAFEAAWVMSKPIASLIRDRRLLAKMLKLLLPGYPGPALKIFRGTRYRERRSRAYSFSWTTDVTVATAFAQQWIGMPGGGVVLETMAPPEAILLVRGDTKDSFVEFEVIVDPFALQSISIRERLLPVAGATETR